MPVFIEQCDLNEYKLKSQVRRKDPIENKTFQLPPKEKQTNNKNCISIRYSVCYF
jgi:hypothetical protein